MAHKVFSAHRTHHVHGPETSIGNILQVNEHSAIPKPLPSNKVWHGRPCYMLKCVDPFQNKGREEEDVVHLDAGACVWGYQCVQLFFFPLCAADLGGYFDPEGCITYVRTDT